MHVLLSNSGFWGDMTTAVLIAISVRKIRRAVYWSTAAIATLANAQSYEGTGELSFGLFGPTNISRSSLRFEFRVADRHWWIKTTPAASAPYDYREASFDGLTVYWLQNLEAALGARTAAGEKLGVNIANSFIQNGGDILHDLDLDEIPAIWLAFCSGAFFKQQTNEMVEPAITFGHSAARYSEAPFKQRALWVLNERFPHTPKEVSYIADGWFRVPPPRRPVRRPKPFDDGFTNVVFRADRFKAFGSLVLPEAASIETFGPGIKADEREKVVLRSRYELKLLSAREAGNLTNTFVPKIPGVTTVIDERFYERAGSLSYFITNSWIDENTLTNSRRFATTVANKVCYSEDTEKPASTQK